MKSTIKIDGFKSIVIQPNSFGPGVQVLLCVMGVEMASAILTPEQCDVLINRVQIAKQQAGAAA